MFRHPDPEVLVVGAGPVGLIAALFLQQHDVRVEIIDMNQRTSQHSYALALHPRTLGVLDDAGLGAELVAAGRKVTTVAFFDGATRRAAVDYSRLTSAHPYLLIVRQSRLERAAEEALRARKANVLWEHRLHALDLGEARPKAEVAQLEKVATGYPVARTEALVVRKATVQPAFVIGADGYDSTVRRMAGIPTEDFGEGQIFSVYETEATGDLPAEVRITFAGDLSCVYWPLEDGRCRWGFQIRDAATHDTSLARLETLIATRAPWSSARTSQIYWSTLAVFDQRLARSLGSQGVWLAGDAAHQAAPVGVQSMNSGIFEARELAARMSWAIREGRAPMLDDFAAGTQASWRRLLDAGRVVRALPNADPWVRDARARIVSSLPASGDDLDALLAQIGLTQAPAGISA